MTAFLSMGATPSQLKAQERAPFTCGSWGFGLPAFTLALLAQMLWIWLFLFPGEHGLTLAVTLAALYSRTLDFGYFVL